MPTGTVSGGSNRDRTFPLGADRGRDARPTDATQNRRGDPTPAADELANLRRENRELRRELRETREQRQDVIDRYERLLDDTAEPDGGSVRVSGSSADSSERSLSPLDAVSALGPTRDPSADDADEFSLADAFESTPGSGSRTASASRPESLTSAYAGRSAAEFDTAPTSTAPVDEEPLADRVAERLGAALRSFGRRTRRYLSESSM
jgi:hypothetical protein